MSRQGAAAGLALVAVVLLGSAPLADACADNGAGVPAAYWTQALRNPSPRLRALAARALGETRDAAAVPALLEALRDPDDEVRLGAVQALGRIGRTAAPAVPVLREALRDPRPEIRAAAARSLDAIAAPR